MICCCSSHKVLWRPYILWESDSTNTHKSSEYFSSPSPVYTNFLLYNAAKHLGITTHLFELMCFLEFEEKYWHKTHAIKSNCNLMGASTTNMLVAHALFMVRVLVWLICPSAELLSICVCQLVVIMSPQGMGIQLEPSVFPTYPAIFCGHGDCMEKYQAINDHVTGCLRFPNPFGTTCALSTVVSPPSENPTKCELSSKRYSPCEL